MLKNNKETVTVLLVGTLLFGLFFYLYAPLAASTVQESDGGELVAAAVSGSLPHPSGYPIYALISEQLVNIIPCNPYHTLSLFSAFTQALAVAALFYFAFLLTGGIVFSASLAIAWGAFEPVMRTATDAEVLALNNLFFFLVSIFAIRLQHSAEKIRAAFLLGLICGLAAAHHSSIVFFTPLVIAVCIQVGRKDSSAEILKLLIIVSAGAAFGLLPYLYLLTLKNSVAFAPLDGFGDLIRYVLRFEYGTFSFHAGKGGDYISYFPHFIQHILTTAPLLFLGLFLPIITLIMRRSVFNFGVALSSLLFIWFTTKLTAPRDILLFGEYMMRMYGMVGAFAAISLAIFAASQKKLLPYLAVLLIAPAIFFLPKNISASNSYADKSVAFELEAILKEIPKNGVFISSLDRTAMGLTYLQIVEQRRPDIIVITPGMLGSESYKKAIFSRIPLLLEFDFNNQPTLNKLVAFFISNGLSVSAYRETPPPDQYAAFPIGITWRWLPKGTTVSYSEITKNLLNFCSRFPDKLLDIPTERKKSILTVQQVFFDTLVELKDKVTEQKERTVLNDIVKALNSSGVQKAKQICKANLD